VTVTPCERPIVGDAALRAADPDTFALAESPAPMANLGLVRRLRDAVRETPQMRFTRHGDPADDDLLLILGWGNDPNHDPVAWLVDRLVDADYRVHAVTLPTNVWDFDRQYVAPVADYAADHEFAGVVAHSTGGLIAAHLDPDARVVYCSPWWGTTPNPGVEALVMPLFLRLPTAKPFFEVERDVSAIGDLKDPDEYAEGPTGVSPAFLRTILDAQSRLPAFDADDVVFCTLTDEVVGVQAIGRHTPAANLRPYDGGHEFFASSGREAVVADLLNALESGPDAV
jgi:hypothetical protein